MSFALQFRLIDRDWKKEFEDAAKLNSDELLIVSPFIKEGALKRLTEGKKKIRVLTRFSPRDLWEGVSDLSALRHLLDIGAEVRGVKNLHAKLYVFGEARGIVTSGNLTEAALTRNHELGFVTDAPSIIGKCREYFEQLWGLAGQQNKVLKPAMLKKWEAQIAAAGGQKGPGPLGLTDEGADLGFLPPPPMSGVAPSITTQAFVKFFGTAAGRSDRGSPIIKEVDGSESNWSLSYPATKRPRQVGTGDVMFISRMVHSPNDTLIYGRAIAYEHVPGRDDASEEDIDRRDWKETWSTFIRVREPEFIAGPLENGISLWQLMEELGHETFVPTYENHLAGAGNTDPRTALMRKAHMRLTQKAADLINARFYEAIAKHGKITELELKKLHCPPLPQA